MKKHIAILAGGDSSESVISLQSAEEIAKQIDNEKYYTYTVRIKGSDWLLTDAPYQNISINKNDFSFSYEGKIVKFDFALIMIHGTPGENGKLQSYFDMIGVPYSSCDAFTSALTFNKVACKSFLKNYDIQMAESLLLRKGQNYDHQQIIAKVGLPCFVKPNAGGSSFGTSKVKVEADLDQAIQSAFSEDDEVIVEAFIDGIEVSNGIFISSKNYHRLAVTEIDTDNEFFDYDAKYSGKTREITPARISQKITEKIQDITKDIYQILNCKGIVRVDYIIQNDIPYFLEINTIPGMSSESIVPRQIKYAHLNLKDILTEIIEDQA